MADEKQTNKIEKSTIYQQLNKLMNLDGFGFQDNQPTTVMQQQASTFPQEKSKIIIKGNSPEEIHKKGLELEQKRELQNKFFRTTDRGFQKALQYEASRLQMYIDFEGMEYYPIISSALDLFMEEATTIGLNGKMLNIYSNKERIKMLLEEFFYDTVNVNVNLPFWVRNTPIKYDSIIPLLNGESITIKELSERLKKNPDEEIWTYSIQDKTNKIVAGKVIWCDLTRKDSDILRVTFDDGTYIETTPDHEYMLRNGSYLRADELNIGASLMPFYTLTSYISGYEKVYNPASNHHVFTHRIVAQECAEENFVNDYAETSSILNHNVISVEKINEKYDVYCMEVVGKNNEQDRHNFPVCSKNKNGEYTRNGVFLSNCKYGDNFVLLYGERKKGITHVKQLVNYEIERFERIQNGKPLVKFKERMTGDEFNVFEIAHFRLLGDDKYLPYGSSILNKVRRVFRQLVMAEDAMLTYRIIRAGEKKVFKIDVGNIDEDDIEEYIYKVATKFKKSAQVNPNDGQIDYRFNILGNDEDYFIPVRNANTETGIDTLPGATNLDAIQDIEYLRDNLFIGLGIPKPFLSFQDAAGAGKNMAQYDIRFSKKINRIQQAIIQELNKMAMVHLYLLGYTGEDLSSFTLTLTNPSTQQELLKSELMRDKAQTYTELTRAEGGIAAMSHTTAKRMIFNMSDKAIVDDLKQQKMEKVVMQELQDSPVTIKKSGLFTDIDKRFGSPEEMPISGATAGGALPSAGGGTGAPPAGGALPSAGGINGGGATGGAETMMENKKNKLSEEDFNKHIEKLVYGSSKETEIKKETEHTQIIQENNEINDYLNNKALNMVNEITNLLENHESINTEQKNIEIQDTEIMDIENIDLNE